MSSHRSRRECQRSGEEQRACCGGMRGGFSPVGNLFLAKVSRRQAASPSACSTRLWPVQSLLRSQQKELCSPSVPLRLIERIRRAGGGGLDHSADGRCSRRHPCVRRGGATPTTAFTSTPVLRRARPSGIGPSAGGDGLANHSRAHEREPVRRGGGGKSSRSPPVPRREAFSLRRARRAFRCLFQSPP